MLSPAAATCHSSVTVIVTGVSLQLPPRRMAAHAAALALSKGVDIGSNADAIAPVGAKGASSSRSCCKPFENLCYMHQPHVLATNDRRLPQKL